MSAKRLILAMVAAALMGGCAPTAQLPPVLSLAEHSCAAQFDLTGARPLQMADKATVKVDENTSCWQSGDGAKSTYLAFRLPSSADPYLVSVTSMPQEKTLFSPRLFVVDSQGTVLRQQPRENFHPHGTSLAASMRVYPSDYALIVASDPASIGTQTSQIVGTTQVTATRTGLSTFYLHTGDEQSVVSVNAHNGTVLVTAMPMPKSN